MAFVPTNRAALAAVAVAALIIFAPPAAAATFSDVGPVGWSTGTGDPNLGVLNQGARTLNFDGGWRFELVNTANTSDPTGLYGNSSNPLASAPGFDDSAWQRADAPARLEHHPQSAARSEQRDRLLPRRPGLVSQDVHAPALDGGQADLGRLRRRVRELVRVRQRSAGRQPPVRVHRLQLRRHRACARRRSGRPTLSPSWFRTSSRAAAGTRAAASRATST